MQNDYLNLENKHKLNEQAKYLFAFVNCKPLNAYRAESTLNKLHFQLFSQADRYAENSFVIPRLSYGKYTEGQCMVR